MLEAMERCQRTGVYEISGKELREWRLAQTGTFIARNGQRVDGWTQGQAAEWFGVSLRTWSGWERGQTPILARVVRRLVDHENMRGYVTTPMTPR